MYNVHLPIMLENERQAVYRERKKENRGLESEERKFNAFITDYMDSCFVIHKSARFVPFVQCRR